MGKDITMRIDPSSARMSQLRVLLLFTLLAGIALPGKTATPVAQKAILDLSQWDWEENGSTNLTGEWGFYWKQLLSPEEAFGQSDTASYLAVPGNWNGKEFNGETASALGYGTYTLQLHLPPSGPILALRIPPIRSSFRLWCNGRQIAGSGTIATNAQDYYPSYKPQIVALPGNVSEMQLVLQVANFHHRNGGAGFPINIGTHAQIIEQNNQNSLYEIFLLATLFVMAFYHFGLYLLRNKEVSALAFAMYCGFSFLRVPLEGHYIFYQIFPGTDLVFWLRVDYLSFLGIGYSFCIFLSRLFPDEWDQRVTRPLIAILSLLAIAILVLPLVFASWYIPAIQVIFVLGAAYCIFVLVKAIRNGREGSKMMFFAVLLFFLAYVNDILYYTANLNTGVMTTSAALLFIFIQAFLLSSRFSKAFSLTEVYARTFQKFVPRQFLDRIAKNGISSIELGNAEPEEAVVLFSDIRGFTALSENLSADEVFQFLNDYLSRMEPHVRKYEGFVDKYLGDAIMALFTQEAKGSCAENAIRSALSMRDSLAVLNQERKVAGLPDLEIGVGLHFGKVIIGTVGGGERMDSTAIGDAVNVASRVEGASKIYKVTLLASEDVLTKLPESHEFRLRFVDRVRVMGREQPVALWEIRGSISDDDHAEDLARIALFERAADDYFEGKFEQARSGFIAFQQLIPDDKAARLYLERCEKQLQTTAPTDWNGVTDLDRKS